MNETAPAKATTAGQIFVSTAANSIAARLVAADFVTTSESTTSTTYTDLATTGPTVTATCSAGVIVAIYCNQYSTANAAWMSYELSGASSDVANDNRAVQLIGTSPGQHVGAVIYHGVGSILVAGVTTFQAKYRISTSGTATYSSRRLLVIPL